MSARKGLSNFFLGRYVAGTLFYLSGNPYITPLIQSGISNGEFFVEYVNSNGVGPASFIQTPAGKLLAAYDEVFVAGFAASDPSCVISTSGAYRCFVFYDITQNWATSELHLMLPAGGNGFLGATAEWAAELPLGFDHAVLNAVYPYGQAMDGEGWDRNGNGHQAVLGDPYIFVTQANMYQTCELCSQTGDILNYATFSLDFAPSRNS